MTVGPEEPESPVSLASPGPTTDGGKPLLLTADDIQEDQFHNYYDNHERSQDVFQQILAHRGVRTSTRAPFLEEQGDSPDHQREAYARHFLSKLKQRGIHGIRTFRVMMHNMDLEGTGTCSGRTMEGALSHMGIRLSAQEYSRFIQLFGTHVGADDMVDYVLFLACGCNNWSVQRQEAVQEAYDYLSAMCPGYLLTVGVLQTKFQSEALTSAHLPGLLDHHSAETFLNQWFNSVLTDDGLVSWLDFLDYYLDISLCFASEHEFCQYVCKSWGIDMDDWLAKKVFNRYVNSESDNILPAKDFVRMLDELDPSITEEEALAWYEAIDEDDSGEVSLQEFLASKVLKVKRLFDRFDTSQNRSVTKEQLIAILRSLNANITDEEAEVLYQYADLDNNGEISFTEFLENALLKLLSIFESFDKARRRCFNEAEMKGLLRKLDPYLDDYELQMIYKAIDTDSSGSIDFVEFCESQVLRAKSLFDRYDTDRSRSLTQFKFRELLLDMDSSLSPSQMEAIYNMVADHNNGKVHLGGFLNPNIVKLKLLFDKYDDDRSRYLDTSELKAMLKDLFKNTTEKDIEILLQTAMPPGCEEGVTFTQYIHQFREILRRHNLIQLARRREARTKKNARDSSISYRD